MQNVQNEGKHDACQCFNKTKIVEYKKTKEEKNDGKYFKGDDYILLEQTYSVD